VAHGGPVRPPPRTLEEGQHGRVPGEISKDRDNEKGAGFEPGTYNLSAENFFENLFGDVFLGQQEALLVL
jgi:hypothetical protein